MPHLLKSSLEVLKMVLSRIYGIEIRVQIYKHKKKAIRIG
jgi:hypothetical protein